MTEPDAAPREPPAGDGRLEVLDAAMRRHQRHGDALLEILHAAQGLYGFLPEEVLVHVARGLRLPPSRVYGVATFYNLFTLRPKGVHVCTVCLGTACWVRGGGAILSAVEETCGAAAGETTPDGKLSVAVVRCIGACGGAPVVAFDGRLSGRETEEGVRARLGGWVRP
jgi:bidirectional [NiFe] hydrogenase diaphorase subunit